MKDPNAPPRRTPGVRHKNDPRAIVEEKLRHAMFDGGWAKWEKVFLVTNSRHRILLKPEPFQNYSEEELTSMAQHILGNVAGVEDVRCHKIDEALIISIPSQEIEKLHKAIDKKGPGEQASNVITVQFGGRP